MKIPKTSEINGRREEGRGLNAGTSKELIDFFRVGEFAEQPTSFLKRRQRLLEAAATSMRLLLEPESDAAFPLLTGRSLDENKPVALDIIERHRANLKELDVRVVGVHFLDQFVGRLSRIWPAYGWADKEYLQGAGEASDLLSVKKEGDSRDSVLGKFSYAWIYSHLWMRVYWSVLRTTTTLINAFHEEILTWNEVPLYFSWHSDIATPPLNLKPAVSFAGLQHEPIRQIAKEIASSIHNHACSEHIHSEIMRMVKTDHSDFFNRPEYIEMVRDLTRRIHIDLERRQILHRFRLVSEQLRLSTLGDPSEWFFNSLEAVSGNLDEIKPMRTLWKEYKQEVDRTGFIKRDVGLWSSPAWRRSMFQIEAIYSSILSGYSFTGESGLWVHRVLGYKSLQAFITVGFGKPGTGGAEAEYFRHLESDLETFFSQVWVKTSELEAEEKKRRTEAEPDPTEKHLVPASLRSDLLSQVQNRVEGLEGEYLQKWLGIVVKLAEEAVHEKKSIHYLLGCGPAYLSRVRCRVFEPAPEYFLTEDGTASYTDKVVHFLKSYHSLFGDHKRICWFDPRGQFRGIYELADEEVSARWFVKWDSVEVGTYLIASITGQGKFDILDRNGVILARYRSGELKTPTGSDELKNAVDRMVKFLFLNRTSFLKTEQELHLYATGLTWFLAKFVSRLQELAVGTSLLVMLDEDIYSEWPAAFRRSTWRLPLDSQVRRLAPKLQFYESWIMETKDVIAAASDRGESAAIIPRVIERLLPLAKLDGATMLRISRNGIRCSPANQLIPLINWGWPEAKGSRKGAAAIKNIRPLDIFSPPPEIEPETLEKVTPEVTTKRLSIGHVRRLSDLLFGQDRSTKMGEGDWHRKLTFLSSAGTRHHSLWGITLTAREPLFAFTLSEDGHLRLFCDGRSYLG